MKQASEKAGRAEAGTRSSSLRTLTATELGDGSQVFGGGGGGGKGGVGTRTCTTATLGTGSKKLCALLPDPQPLWISSLVDRLSPAPPILLPPPLASGPSAVPKGGERAALRVSNQPSGPVTPRILQQPLPHRAPFVRPLSLPAPRLGPIRSLQPPRQPGRASRALFSVPSP